MQNAIDTNTTDIRQLQEKVRALEEGKNDATSVSSCAGGSGSGSTRMPISERFKHLERPVATGKGMGDDEGVIVVKFMSAWDSWTPSH
eukprot:2646322-Karenia_brevis.AAC.1